MNYLHIANSDELKVVYVYVDMSLTFHVKTRHVPRIGDNIMLGNGLYKIARVSWNPKKDLLATFDLDVNADCVIFLDP